MADGADGLRAAAGFITTRHAGAAVGVKVTYWDGSAFVPVKNLDVTLATATNPPSTLAFDPVNTTQVKLEMTSPAPGTNAGFFRITELEANGKQIEPSLLDLKVDGVSVRASTRRSRLRADAGAVQPPPVITGTTAADETDSVALPASLPGAAR